VISVRIIIFLLFLTLPITNLLSSSHPNNWYLEIKKDQIEIIVAPENSSRILDLLYKANRSIYMEVYVLTNNEVVSLLYNLSKRGVEVLIVLSGRVVGGIPASENNSIKILTGAGAKVRFNYDFRFVHSKVFVIDNESVILGSINPSYYDFNVDKGLDIAIHNSTIAKIFASIIIADFYGISKEFSYPGIVVSPLNSEEMLRNLLSQQGDLYIAIEELFPSSDMFSIIKSHKGLILVSDNQGNSEAAKDLNAKVIKGLSAKIIIVSDYVYVGSINLSSSSLHYNRELGVIIKNPEIASNIRNIILNWAGVTSSSLSTSLPNYSQLGIIIVIILIILILILFLIRRF
jgi:phosphatidylserine/phosphatidylglycerophosphate/cardiolipin synthase-like enzyme